SRIAQLLSNLVGNAITHGSHTQPVVVRAVSDGAIFTLSVSNGGTPLPPAEQERLFLPFAQGAPRPNQPGLGLG
ncbi:sensor histidine kinase, partial [Citrobacter freundii]|uniref:sensor histidine kinase n=1 Tax=Citrobacter freundii TaxID=546 RepID=UPI0013D062F5